MRECERERERERRGFGAKLPANWQLEWNPTDSCSFLKGVCSSIRHQAAINNALACEIILFLYLAKVGSEVQLFCLRVQEDTAVVLVAHQVQAMHKLAAFARGAGTGGSGSGGGNVRKAGGVSRTKNL